jgi:hypothetical protein
VIDGVPWLAPGERRVSGITSLASNILCQRHNSALSPLDAEALLFFKKLKQIRDSEGGSSISYFCGPALELWALKAACGTFYSKNASIGRRQLIADHQIDEVVVADAFFRNRWHRDCGLYVNLTPLPQTGEDQIQIRPATTNDGVFAAFEIAIIGLRLWILFDPRSVTRPNRLTEAGWIYRPPQLDFTMGDATHSLLLW